MTHSAFTTINKGDFVTWMQSSINFKGQVVDIIPKGASASQILRQHDLQLKSSTMDISRRGDRVLVKIDEKHYTPLLSNVYKLKRENQNNG
ncbi:hypothetical protein [Leptospira sp. GIMC2001]|uniref:hypothetical protein n=1 Tax=Leptospira sp. GIMC2001 TaxID=1513297 RepID=UPI00234BB0C2|nr:hypothetical protein [Leptospira sp. GIMC2001]WCL51443.1 hypothetical protein O4O04_20215 [Leptospira sp. GIMC2001]